MSEPATFCLELVVAGEDIDMLGHASNVAFVRWIQDAALAHSAAVGLGFETYQRLGVVFIVVRHEIDYLRPALRGDIIEARTWITNVMAAKCLRATELVRKADGQMLARSSTTWGFIELATGRPKRITAEVRGAFEAYIHSSPPKGSPLPLPSTAPPSSGT
jgi:acyl-CoA thioester hydrolase